MDTNKYTNKASIVSGANDFTSSLHEAMFQSPTPYDRFVDEFREVNEDSGGNENIPSSAESSHFKKQADIVMEATPRKHKPVVIIDVTLND
tara:strand:- start:54 stop:326 length:273 start_codon:yes stop_codon:yes gene_type:complete